ncbi:5-methylthioadenosine/S-adenosylhomocysteine deaminase [Frondihabitans sp. PhB188]|uniref:amidohydrolase family protein n=1 Tax=Frondihabitans sp. PhB188 TaxID=2485200 RepID=UPI000F4A6FDC|nr:amidohydrolase [Frondihabitans sp. PhB188]ROQ41607.1 5-methylthioadenosine/S-adenosylhomocysteine deaminase [Frondihabitans sp. PhB188]
MRILTADHLVTMNAALDVIVGGAVAIDGDAIAAVGTIDEVVAAHPGAARDDLGPVVLMPGLINAHHHSGMLRGTAEHLPVWEWLRLHIDPMHRVLRPEEAEAAAWLCYAEGILSGTTTVVDMWRYLDGAARAAETLGNRLVTVNYTGAHPDYDYFDTLDDNERMLRDWSGAANGRIVPWVGLEHPFYADDAGRERAIAMARHYDTGLYTHLSESEIELAEFDERYGARPIQALEKLGWFDAPRAFFAHAVWLDQSEIEVLAGRAVGISHNPVSNMKLASGMAPVAEFLAAGIPVGLGTDGEKENNNLDMFEELKTASLLGKLRTMDAAAMDSWEVLTMATVGGAKALGQELRLGSLEVGKQADLIAVRSDTPRMTPLIGEGPYANVHHNLVHAVQGSDVSLTMVAGAVVARDGVLVNADLAELIARVRSLVPGLFARRSAYLASVGDPDGLFPA